MSEEFIKAATKRISKQSEIKEIDIEEAFCKYAKSKKCRAIKLVYSNKKGFPDRTVLVPGGRTFFIEFKKKDKPQSSAQITTHKLLIRFGYEYHVCDEIGQAENILDKFLLSS